MKSEHRPERRAHARLPLMSGEAAALLVLSLDSVIGALWRAHGEEMQIHFECAGIPCWHPDEPPPAITTRSRDSDIP